MADKPLLIFDDWRFFGMDPSFSRLLHGRITPQTAASLFHGVFPAEAQFHFREAHFTRVMVHFGQVVPRTAVQPGDVLFLNPDSNGPAHVALIVNPTTIIEAPDFGIPVKLSPFPTRFVVIKRVL